MRIVYRTDAIILHVQDIRDLKKRVILFTREYGKITCWYKKKEYPFGTGDWVNISVDRANGENILKETSMKKTILGENWCYATTISFLEILSTLLKFLPDSVPHGQIFDDYTALLLHMRQEGGTSYRTRFTLFQFRTLRFLGFIDGASFVDKTRLQYIYHQSIVVPIRRLLESKELLFEELQLLEKSILQTKYYNL